MLFRVAAPINPLNAVRTLAWNATMRAGDDMKIAFTLLDEDCETPVSVRSARATLKLHRRDELGQYREYGMYHGSYYDGAYGAASATVDGVVVDTVGEGRINFYLPATSSLALCAGRYRAFIAVDQYDGLSTEIEGLVQVRPHARNDLTNSQRQYFTIARSGIGQALIAPYVIGGVPCDIDGFPLTWMPSLLVGSGSTAVLGNAVLGQMVLGGVV